MGKSTYENATRELDTEIEKIKKAAENCAPEMKDYLLAALGDGRYNHIKLSYDLAKSALKSDATFEINHKAHDIIMEQNGITFDEAKKIAANQEIDWDQNKHYQEAKQIINTLRYMAGLTNEKNNLWPNYEKRDPALRHFFPKVNMEQPDWEPYREMGVRKNIEEATFYSKREQEMMAEIDMAKRRALDGSPQIRKVLEEVLDPEKQPYQEFLGKLEACKENNSIYASKDKIVQDQDYLEAYKFVETVKYLAKMPADQEMLLDSIGGKRLEELQKDLQVEKFYGAIQDTIKETKKQGEREIIVGNAAIGMKYPAVDPTGVYAEKQAELKERLARIHAAKQFRPDAVQDMLSRLEESDVFLTSRRKMNQRYEKIHTEYIKEKNKNPENEHVIDQEYRDALKKQNEKERDHTFQQVIEVMEYLAGIGPEPREEVRAKMRRYIQPELGREQVKKPWDIGRMDIEFENMDKMLTNMQKAVPKYKKMSENSLEKVKVNDQAAKEYLKLCFTATANRLLDPLYQQFEQGHQDVDRTDLLIVNGKTVKSIMEEKLGQDEFRNMDPETKRQQTALLVANELQQGNRVEAFIPQEDGRVSSVPVVIGKSGCAVQDMRKINDGFWMQILYAIGDFFGITHRAKEKETYENTLATRRQVCDSLNEKGILDRTNVPQDYERDLLGEEREANANEDTIEISL